MKLIIDIPDNTYTDIQEHKRYTDFTILDLIKTIRHSTPIPDDATNERMIGKWIKSRDSYGTNHFTCPFCEHDIATRNADNWDDNYCSNCGARMEGVEYEKGYTL